MILLPGALVISSISVEKLEVTANTTSVHQGRVVHFKIIAKNGRFPSKDLLIAPFINGKRWGTLAVTDSKGRAEVDVPMRDQGEASVTFDVIAEPNAAGAEFKWGGPNTLKRIRGGDPLGKPTATANTIIVKVLPPWTEKPLTNWDLYSDTWVATDGLGRQLPTFKETGPPKANKSVGLFYYLWQEFFSREALAGDRKLRDVTNYLAANPSKPNFDGGTYWWSQPLFGYYNSSDPYILKKHVHMLENAGVDTLIYDTSNDLAYWEQWFTQEDAMESIREQGMKTPSFAHLCWASSGTILPQLDSEFYDKGIYKDLWFQWKGKPLLLADWSKVPKGIEPKYSDRWSWAWHDPRGWFGDGHDKWMWIDDAPQAYGWHESKDHPEEMPVSAGHHASSNKGKSLSHGVEPDKGHQTPGLGIQFDEQWKNALRASPDFVYVTQWNEWIAGAFPTDHPMMFDGRALKTGDRYFIDEYNPEFSRDTEPMAGGYGDNFYYQLVANIRRYKGCRPLPKVTLKSLKLRAPFSQWNSVQPEYRDAIGDETHRDGWSWGWLHHYKNTTGRNDIVACKTTWDANNAYFYVKTKNHLTPKTGKDWMTLYIDTDSNSTTGWLGYDYRITGTSIQRNVGGKYQWETIGQIHRRIGSNEMQLVVSRKLFQFSDQFDFKWADNCYQRGDWSDFTLNGDAAPDDRFNYRATIRE